MKIQWLYNIVQTSSYIQEQEGQISSGVKKKTSLDRWQKDSFVAEWLEEKSIEMERNSSADPKQVTSSVKHGRDHVILQACMADRNEKKLLKDLKATAAKAWQSFCKEETQHLVTFTDSRSPAFSSKYQNQIMLSWPTTFKPLKIEENGFKS